MHVVRDVLSLRAAVAKARAAQQRIGFVPTMGALHAGHLSLLDRARAACECVVLSIFVNPLQFAPTEDLAKYPRTESEDLALAEKHGTSIAFIPSVDVMYPGGRAISLVPDAIGERWEGAVRPGHFAGVLTVVAKLFNLVQPDLAVFGQKDLQQATLIAALVRDLDFPIVLDIAPIVRESDGLAMSSRNRYLNTEHRMAARVLSRALAAMQQAMAHGEKSSVVLIAAAKQCLAKEPAANVEYLSVVNAHRLEPCAIATAGDFAILAARVGNTRLLDNHRLGDAFPSIK